MTEENLYQKLKSSNKDYHENVDLILADIETIPDAEERAEVKATFADHVKNVFVHMKLANDAIEEYYQEE